MWQLGHPCSHACRVLGLQRSGLDVPVFTHAVFQGCHVVSYACDGSSTPACWLSVSYGCHVVACARPFTHLPCSRPTK